MTKAIVHTIGDSTLDNLFWMLGKNYNLETAKKMTVEGKTESLLKKNGIQVESHAYDGFTTKSVLNGDIVGAVLPHWAYKRTYMKEKVPATGVWNQKIYPLQELENSIKSNPKSTHYVVLSVGGNDFRENLLQPWRIFTDISQIQQRYLEIVDKIKDPNLKAYDICPILMLQYRTDAVNDAPYYIYTLLKVIGIAAASIHLISIALMTAPLWLLAGPISTVAVGALFATGFTGLYLSRKFVPLSATKNILCGHSIALSVLDGLMRKVYQPILEKAKEAKIPVLDLPNTFNPYKKLYDCCIEPNAEGGSLIAQGITHIVRNHDFSKESALYSKADKEQTYTKKPNLPSSWSVPPVAKQV